MGAGPDDDVDPALASAWDELADRVAAPPFLRPGWTLAWRAAFGGPPLTVFTSRRDGTLTGVLPVQARRARWSAPANWHTPVFGPLATTPDDARVIAEDLAGSPQYVIDLRFLDPTDTATATLRATLADRARRTIERVVERPPYVDATGSWEDYVASLDGKFVRELRRRRRRLDDEGRVALDVHDGAKDVPLDAVLDEGFAVEASGWKGQGGTAIAAQPATERFYRAIARWAAERGWLRLALLRVDGQAIAFDFALEDASSHHLLKTGYDPAFARFSPGNQLRWEMVQRTFAAPAQTYEFLGRDDAWKHDWTSTLRERVRLQAFGRSVRGVLGWTAWHYGRPAAKWALETARARR